MKVGGKALDLRVATLPTVYGEKVVIRVLDKSHGACFGSRSSGSWRTPTSASRSRSASRTARSWSPARRGRASRPRCTRRSTSSTRSTRNIITVEDPVEYRLAGVNQMQVNPKAGLTFASALRSILRADPDIVLIGEIRDKETATIAIEAALTGHLVLSSLHTNDAPSAHLASGRDGGRDVPGGLRDRLPWWPSASLRKLCERCKEAYRPEEAELLAAGYPEWLWPEIEELYRPVGLPARARTPATAGAHRAVRSDADDRRDRTAHGGACICR